MEATREVAQRCHTCLGEGETANEFGPYACPDCQGLGLLPTASVLRERRLREIEAAHGAAGQGHGETGRAIDWLVSEVRRSQDALTQIMTAALELPDGHPLHAKLRHLANRALDLYPVDSEN